MLKLIVGVKGTGKTKKLIDMVNGAAAVSNGSVICIEKGANLNFDITHKARLINVDEFAIGDGQSLYGFVAGITASDHDITDIFVDSPLKICNQDLDDTVRCIEELAKLSEKVGYTCTLTLSIDAAACPDSVKKYL